MEERSNEKFKIMMQVDSQSFSFTSDKHTVLADDAYSEGWQFVRKMVEIWIMQGGPQRNHWRVIDGKYYYFDPFIWRDGCRLAIYTCSTQRLRFVLSKARCCFLDQIGFTLVKMGYYKNLLVRLLGSQNCHKYQQTLWEQYDNQQRNESIILKISAYR